MQRRFIAMPADLYSHALPNGHTYFPSSSGIDTVRDDSGNHDLDQETHADADSWLFPRKYGPRHGSNTEAFRAEIEERTRNGESCDQIAAALAAKGVQTSSKTVARQRIKWGFRKRAIRGPNKNPSRPRPPRPSLTGNTGRKTLQNRHRADIAHMTGQGLNPDEIATIMTSRGMKLSKGATTIRRLQTRWDLLPDEQRTLINRRHLMRKKAREQQKKEFENFAAELGLGDPAVWVEQKLKDPTAISRRRQHAQRMLEDTTPAGRGFPGETDADSERDAEGTPETRFEQPGRSSADLNYHRAPQNIDPDLADGSDYAPIIDVDWSEADADDRHLNDDVQAPSAPNRAEVYTLSAEENRSNALMISSAESLATDVQAIKEIFVARSRSRPLKTSLTGLPPTAADVAVARQKLSTAARKILESLT